MYINVQIVFESGYLCCLLWFWC